VKTPAKHFANEMRPSKKTARGSGCAWADSGIPGSTIGERRLLLHNQGRDPAGRVGESTSPVSNLSKGIHMLQLLNGEQWQRWVPIPIRMILGVGFMVHGWAKWSRGPAAFAELLGQAHVPLPLANAWLVTLLEIFGGLALLVGAFVALVSVPLIFSMLGAMFTVNINYGFSAVNTIGLTPEGPQFGPPGYEINLLYIAGLLALILGGAGPLSIDALRSRRRQQRFRVAA
jgi:putative oxidoreductase